MNLNYSNDNSFFLISITSFCQNQLAEFEPVVNFGVLLSTKKGIPRQSELLLNTELNITENMELDTLVHKYDEVVESVWDIIDAGCSWYCDGQHYKVSRNAKYLAQIQEFKINY